jgi:hypothetical protein
MAFLAFAASASATTLEVNGVTQNSSVSLSASRETGFSATLARTDGSLANTCTTSTVEGTTSSPFTGTKVTAAISSLTFGNCTRTVTVDKAGQLYVEHIAGTTNGTVFSENAEVTVLTPLFGAEVNCKTGEGVDIGLITGATTKSNPEPLATIDIDAVCNCGFLLPSATWSGKYWLTGPADFGISA